MTSKAKALSLTLLFLLSLGLAAYLSVFLQSGSYTILSHSLRFAPLEFALLAIVSFLLMAALWVLIGRTEARMTGEAPGPVLGLGLQAFLPFAFLLLSPLLLAHYTTREDLRTRLEILAGFALLAFLALTRDRLRRTSGARWPGFGKALALFESWSRRKKIAVLFLAAFVVYNLAVLILVAQGVEFSGDEPNYLITADSLYYDKDINLANNYANEDWFHFYSKEEHPKLKLGIYGRYGKEGKDHIYPINLPGVSVLTLPFYALGRLLGGKALTFFLKGSLSVWAALLGVQIFLFAEERWKRTRMSLGLWALYAFSAPAFFYAVHLYPEVPVAFMSLLIYRKVSSDRPLKPALYPLLGLLLATFSWFGVKYNIIFWPLLVVACYHMWRTHGARLRRLAAFLVFPLVSTALFYLYVHSLYGTFSPFSIYEGVQTAEQFREWRQMVLHIPFRERLDAFLDYFLDQRDGLLLYSPLYVFAFLGFVEMFRKARHELFGLVFIALPFVLNYGFFTHRQGYSPQGRVLMPVSWVAAVAIGYFLAHNRKPFFAGAFRLAAFAGLSLVVVMLLHPSFLYQPTTHDFTERPGALFLFLGNMHVFLPSFLPSFIKIDNTHYAPNYAWAAALLGFILLYVFLKREREARSVVRTAFVLVLTAAGAFLWVLYPRAPLYPVETISYSETRTLGLHTFSMGKGVVVKPAGGLYLHAPKRYRFLFSSRRPLDEVRIAYGSEKGEYGIAARFFDLPLFEDRTILENKEFILAPPASYRVKGLYLYEIGVDLVKYSTENMQIDPYFFSITPVK
jgi:hypothetical protein